jgi:uncharacterized protein (DUF302 family)/uncharacterized membrane protein YidH (DUF202 family)
MADRQTGPADFLAAERTFLAWIRTGLALMGFGFVVARFGLFLQAMQLGQPSLLVPRYGLSFWFGTALIVLGVVVNVVCAMSHVRLIRDLKTGGTDFAQPSRLAIAVAGLLALLGLAMAMYLALVREPPAVRRDASMDRREENGIVTIASQGSVEGSVRKLEAILAEKGVKLFATIDHSGEAEKAGLCMPPTKLVIFGNPRAGTPVMLASPSAALDLPLKILVWEDDAGKVWISYNSPDYLAERHGISTELANNLAVVEGLAAHAAH